MKRISAVEKHSILCDVGAMPPTEICKKYNVSKPTLYAIIRKYGHWEYIMDRSPMVEEA